MYMSAFENYFHYIRPVSALFAAPCPMLSLCVLLLQQIYPHLSELITLTSRQLIGANKKIATVFSFILMIKT